MTVRWTVRSAGDQGAEFAPRIEPRPENVAKQQSIIASDDGADIGALTPRGSPITKRSESMLASASKCRLLCESFAMRKTRAKHSLDKDVSQRARLGNIDTATDIPWRCLFSYIIFAGSSISFSFSGEITFSSMSTSLTFRFSLRAIFAILADSV